MYYGFDYIDGKEIPPLVVTEDFVISGVHEGTVHVESGVLTINGVLRGTLGIHEGSKVIINGKQNGTVFVDCGAEVIIHGELCGTTTVNSGSVAIVEQDGKLSGTLQNNGELIVRGIFSGAQSGNGEIVFEGHGQIK